MSTEQMRKLITLLEGNVVHGAPAHLFESEDIDAEFIAHVNSNPALKGASKSDEMVDESEDDDIDDSFINHVNSHPSVKSKMLDESPMAANHCHDGECYVNDSNPGIKIHDHPMGHSVSVHGMHVGTHDNFDDAVNASNHLAAHVRSKPRV